jgi:uncharacterized phage protein gp47/JayE
MAFGVTPEGLVIKRLADIRQEMNEDAQGVYGLAVDLDVRRPLGQFISIQGERIAQIWELIEQLNNSFSPRNAEGKQFDEVAAYAGLQRREATFSTVGIKLIGVQGTVVPAGKRASVQNAPESIFATDAAYTIGAGDNDIQEVTFDVEPVAGAFTLLFNGQSTAAINWNATAAAVKAALESLGNIDEVNVTGDFYAGFTIEFTGDDAEQPQSLLVVGSNTLSSDGVAVGDVDISTAKVQTGELPNVEGTATALTAGPIPAPAGTLTVLEDSVTGWDAVTNPLDAEQGSAEEADPDFKIRRASQIAASGRCTPNAIRARMLEVPGVESCSVYVNNQNTTVGGLPAKSVRIVLVGGEPAAIAQQAFDNVAAGILTYGDELYNLVDDSGFTQPVRWDEATEIPIYVELDLTTTDDFPLDGEDQIIANILAFGEALGTGDDVIVRPYLLCTVDVPGITDVVIRVGTTVSPSTDNNVTIAQDELAKFDSSRITISIVS